MSASAATSFYLGTHEVGWLERTAAPLFISHRRLAPRRRLPRALGSWALDSGGFTELSLHGRWQTLPAAYAAAVRRYRDEIGGMAWAACQDWMFSNELYGLACRCRPRFSQGSGHEVMPP